jgi:outer membrane protein assembly factor BamA
LLTILLVACPRARGEPPPPDPRGSTRGEPSEPTRGEAPAPDPTRGERYDGRAVTPGAREALLLIPRLALTPARLIFRAVGWAAHGLIEWDERNRALATVAAAFSSRDGLIGVRPAFQYSISFTPILGLRFFDRKLLGPATNVELTAMSGNLDTVFASAVLRPTPGDRLYEVDISAVYNRRNDQVFTGIGYVTDDPATVERPARYAIDQVDAIADVSLTVAPGVFLGFATGLGWRYYGDGVSIAGEPPLSDIYCVRAISGLCRPGTVDEVRVPGFARGTQFFRAGARVRIDSRDNFYRPSSGGVFELGGEWTHGLGSDESHYLRGHAALSGVLDLWRRSRSLVVRFEADIVEPIGFAVTPFSELVVLGGPDSLRGFRFGRFRNFSSLFAALEYRWPVWMWMDAVAFAEYGGVFGRHFEGFSVARMRPDVGLGVRLRSSEAFYVRAHAAYGWGDGWQLSIALNTGL